MNFSFSNFSSFKNVQTFSLLASEKYSEHPENIIDQKFLKSSLIYGANASGKTNFVDAFYAFRDIVLDSTSSEDKKSQISQTEPFLLGEESNDEPTQFEITFEENSLTYRYGLSFNKNEILEEWLYTKKLKETEVFFREKQKIVYKKTRFTELDGLIEDNSLNIASTIPAISVAALSSKKVCRTIINYIKKIKIISGIDETGFKSVTYDLFKQDEEFREWALNILKNFNIHNLIIDEIDSDQTNSRIKVRKLKVEVVKKTADGFKDFPISFESEGTRKVLYLLGPLYDSIKSNYLLIIDELGYLPIDKADSKLFFQLIDLRYEKKSTIITTNINFITWDDIFYDAVVANAILDRILHHSHVISISGKSYRLKDHMKPAED